MDKKQMASPKKEVQKQKQKTEKAKPKAPAPKVEAEAKVKAPKSYLREGVTPVGIVSCEEILLNGRSCYRVVLADGTTDVVSESDSLGRLVW